MSDRIKPQRAGAYIVRGQSHRPDNDRFQRLVRGEITAEQYVASVRAEIDSRRPLGQAKARLFAQSVREARDAAFREGAAWGFLVGLVVGAVAGVLFL